MGSLASRPKAPETPSVQYVYVPSLPAASSVTASASPGTLAPAPSAVPDDDDIKADARASNLLERRRGRLSTVLTSFRGLLGDGLSGARKTLLGE